MANEIGKVRVIANPLAPDLFVDDVIAVEEVNDTVRLTLAVAKMDEAAAPSPISLVVVGRLIMTDQSAQRLAISLLNHLRSQGVDLARFTAAAASKAN